MGAKTGSIFFQKEPEQERSAKEKVKKECTYKLARGGGGLRSRAYSWHCKQNLQQLRVLRDRHLIHLKIKKKRI
jgi:hypothetical protein